MLAQWCIISHLSEHKITHARNFHFLVLFFDYYLSPNERGRYVCAIFFIFLLSTCYLYVITKSLVAFFHVNLFHSTTSLHCCWNHSWHRYKLLINRMISELTSRVGVIYAVIDFCWAIISDIIWAIMRSICIHIVCDIIFSKFDDVIAITSIHENINVAIIANLV